MVNNYNNAPIHTLHNDILWRIFGINADIYWVERKADVQNILRPLTVLRKSSQVCREWRQIILKSPSLWSRAFDLDVLLWGKEKWWGLVLERSARSPLCINGQVIGRNIAFRYFFASLLRYHWTRIRKLEVVVSEYGLFTPETWAIFLRPAPKLEIFNICLTGSALTNPDLPLFDNHAPCLKEFSFPDPSTGYLPLDAPWLPQLRTLEFTAAYTAMKLVNALGSMQNLIRLHIRESVLEPEGQPLAAVSLPHLHGIWIFNTIRTLLFLLKHITPAPGATLSITNEDADNIVFNEDLFDLFIELSRHAKNYFNKPTGLCKSLTLKLWRFRIRFRVYDTTDTRDASYGPDSMTLTSEFRTDILCRDLPPEAIPAFLTALDIRQYTFVTKFKFIPLNLEISEDIQPVLTNFLSFLSSVKVIITPRYGLCALLKAVQAQPDLFPALQTLWIKHTEPTDYMFMDTILGFLRWRSRTGRPLNYVNITESTICQEWLDWGFLGEFVGLKVIIQWGNNGEIEEYVCGSGAPETLDMRRRTQSF